jgi:pimeloyl-ACP methyl ester carboxylesterase
VSRQAGRVGSPLVLSDHGCFYVGGCYVDGDERTMQAQMFVDYMVPSTDLEPDRVVMIHGGGQTGAAFLTTPDGRPGWADYFLRRGYAVYIVDVPGRGRSRAHDKPGSTAQRSPESVADLFTAPRRRPQWPQSAQHSQWPGDGVAGDPVFDQFYASQVPRASDTAQVEAMAREAGIDLLERIGPSVLLTHSQGGPIGWGMADARPDLVRAIVAVEPNGPPVHDVRFVGQPDWFDDDVIARPWGITRNALRFEPPARSSADLSFTRQAEPDGPDLARCWLQAEPARTLPQLSKVPILVVTGEASLHAPYDHGTSAFLRQAGVEHDYVRLPEVGIRGNGHMMMLEQNSDEIAAFLLNWIEQHAVLSTRTAVVEDPAPR